MDTAPPDNPAPAAPAPQSASLEDRVSLLEKKVERLANEMRAIAKMKAALDLIFGNDKSDKAE